MLQNIVEYETVLANGSIVNVNAKNYPDLFLAKKAGGNQFGIFNCFMPSDNLDANVPRYQYNVHLEDFSNG
jgi:hypothetical protein